MADVQKVLQVNSYFLQGSCLEDQWGVRHLRDGNQTHD